MGGVAIQLLFTRVPASRWMLEVDMYSRWIEMERYRYECVSAWPDSPLQRATLAGIAHALKSLGIDGDSALRPVSARENLKLKNVWSAWDRLAA